MSKVFDSFKVKFLKTFQLRFFAAFFVIMTNIFHLRLFHS